MTVANSYVNVRFTKDVSRIVRRGRQRGDMSRRVVRALSLVDLQSVALIEARCIDRCLMTQVAVPEPLYAHVKALAVERSCSFNRIVNSALRALVATEAAQ